MLCLLIEDGIECNLNGISVISIKGNRRMNSDSKFIEKLNKCYVLEQAKDMA